jgi:hypothetical protein
VRETGIEGAINVHRTGLTSGFRTKEAALAFARLVLRPRSAQWQGSKAQPAASAEEDADAKGVPRPRENVWDRARVPAGDIGSAGSEPAFDRWSLKKGRARDGYGSRPEPSTPPKMSKRTESSEEVLYYAIWFHQFRTETLTANFPLNEGDWVIAEAERGLDIGRVVGGSSPRDPRNAVRIPKIVRLATPTDMAFLPEKRREEQKGLEICHRCVIGQNMDIIGVEWPFDGPTVRIYYCAPQGVDYKPLIPLLCRELHHRIWLHRVYEPHYGSFAK